ncbi:phage tail sheath subtilisin-like domain-containing protein [Asticcacaulis sp. YBE204]|uniref:phage tail sheath subtilisin-like domain-containing protein n=1 Tax=Asticcacaulis sp. YBE204 TaxID=1282363 RepID=UPI0003C40B62|nr:phage tail sheath subtilisin-like domain-containing protein [Asticcacaulis sp. YBE204]ESQ78513.1 hypothetical protein AEYBE204_13255 [Asticcacaulis sp. YBE204]
MISFSQIPTRMFTPGAYAEFDFSQLESGLIAPRLRTVLFGHKVAAGIKATNTLIRVNTASEAIAYFGRGSMLARMVEKYRLNDKTVPLYAVAVPEPAGNAATGTIVIGGTTAAGTLCLYVGGQKLPIQVNAAQATTATATAIGAAINAAVDLPVTASVAASTVTLTARHIGTLGNGIDIRHSYRVDEAAPVGMTVTITALSGGTGSADLTAALAAVGDEYFSAFVSPFADATNVALLETTLDGRSNAMEQSDGLAFVPWSGTLSALQTLGDARNSEFSVPMGLKGCPAPDWERAAATVAPVILSAQADPGRPFQTLEVKGILPPIGNDKFDRQERQYLLESGVSTYTVYGESLRIETMVTTRKTDSNGAPTDKLKLINAMLILFYLRFSWNNRIVSRYPRSKLADDGSTAPNTITPKIGTAEAVAIGLEWFDAGLIENYPAFKAAVVCERDKVNTKQLNLVLPPDLIDQALVFATKIQPRG